MAGLSGPAAGATNVTDGRFSPLRVLGEGGQGRVVAVRDAARGGQVVALKETTPGGRADLEREFLLLTRLRHPNLVAVYDWFATSPLAAPAAPAAPAALGALGARGPAPAAYTQEWVDGRDLFTALRQASLTERERVFEEVLRALAYLHALDVVHLDLKPDNVLVGPDGAARVLDFGIARGTGEVDASVRGSRSYVAPERLAGAAADARADLYALGVMMAEVWAGEPPSPEALRGPLGDAGARATWMRERGVPETWLATVVALTAQDPGARPVTVADAAALWSRGLRRALRLHTPVTCAAILRAGPPAGRDAELAACAGAVTHGRAVVLTGLPGSGRRTVARAAGRAAQVRGHAVEFWPGAPDLRSVSGFAAALGRLTGGDPGLDGRTPDAPAADLEAFAAWTEREATRVVSLVGQRPPTAARPLLVVEDLDDAPRLVQAVVRAFARAAEGGATLPLALVVTATAWDGPAALGLGPLGREAVEALVDARLGAEVASSRLGATLAAASGGQPEHLEALLDLLVARGDLRYEAGRWRWQPGEAVVLPAGMADAVAQRLELLPTEARDVLAALAWLRHPATAAEIEAARGGAFSTDSWLAELAVAGLTYADSHGRHHVAHPAVAQALVGWVPPGGSDQAHQRVLAGLGADTPALVRAWHTRGQGGARLAMAEADRVRAEGRLEDAAQACELALTLAPGLEDALASRAEIANLLGPREVQVASLEALLAVLAPADPRRLGVESRLFWALTRIGDADRAEEVGRRVLRLAEAAEDPQAHAEALVHLANVVIQRGDYGEGERLLAEALRRAEGAAEVVPTGLRARIHNNLGNVLAYRDEHEGALTRYQQALELKRVEGDPVGQRIAVGNVGLMCLELGRYDEALTHLAESLAAARALGHRRGEAWSLLALAVLGLEGGALAYAERRAGAALAVAEELGDLLVACDAETTLAEIRLAGGDAAGARELAARGLSRVDTVRSAYNAAGARAVLAAAWLDQDPSLAAELAEDAWRSGLGGKAVRAAAARARAEAALRLGRLDGAAAAARDVLATTGRALSLRALATAERVLRACGDCAGADAVVARARAVLDERTTRWPEAPRADGAIGEAELDGPCRATFVAQAEAARLMVGTRERDEGGAAMATTVAAARAAAPLERAAWAARVAAATGEAIGRLVFEWLQGFVVEHGAERGFLVRAAGEGAEPVVMAACDLDGEAIAAPERKLPEAVVDAVVAGGRPWRASGSAGRGAVAGLPVRVPGGAPVVLVLQNRFTPEAFAELVAAPPELGPPALLLRLQALEQALAAAEGQVREAETRRRAELTRSTEEILTLRRELESTREQLGPANAYPEIVFRSQAMRKMLRRLDRVVGSALPVYIHGESGTGKELVARAIHEHGPRARGPFVAQNCSAIPQTLFESEFFGHERGAFTGADRPSDGLFRRADGGTLFLDEIGDLPLELQAKLLRVLETGEVRPVGGRQVHRVDVRIICATHRDLKDLALRGDFREDLYYRLNVVRVDVPALRERPDDIPLLVEHFLAHGAPARAGAGPLSLGPGVMKALIAYAWPGNVRQLENEITRAALLCDGEITLADLSDDVRSARPRPGASPRGAGSGLVVTLGLDEGTLKDRVDRLEAWVLEETLRAAGGNKSQVARDLGLSRAGLNMKLKRLDLWDGDD